VPPKGSGLNAPDPAGLAKAERLIYARVLSDSHSHLI
jgi:hypothetical protein